MNDALIGFEVAKLAKEKGFDEYCSIGWVTKEIAGKYLNYHYKYNFSKDFVIQDDVMFCPLYEPYYLTPTQSLLQKWLREKHQIIVTITPTFTYSLITKIGYYCTVETPNEDLYSMECKNPDLYFYSTYEEALESGLKEALTLIK